MRERLLIIGASVRPWVQSALAAEFEVSAYDFFADWDTCRVLQLTQDLPVALATRKPSSIQPIQSFRDLSFAPGHSFAAELDACDAALVCGGMETRIDQVRQIESRIRLMGPGSRQLDQVQNAAAVFHLLEQQKIPIPETRARYDETGSSSNWLRKLNGSSGGLGVRATIKSDAFAKDRRVYFQKKVPGETVSGVFVSLQGSSSNVETRLLGVTRQKVGVAAVGAVGFQYCGSVGPISVSSSMAKSMQAVASLVGAEFEMAGVWGIDFVVTPSGLLPIDVNPRLTASMELFESRIATARVQSRSLVELHVRSCIGDVGLAEVEELQHSIATDEWRVEGKAILFNNTAQELVVSPAVFDRLKVQHAPTFFGTTQIGFSIADVPHENQSIPVGRPVMTLRVRTDSQQDVWELLCKSARDVFKAFETT